MALSQGERGYGRDTRSAADPTTIASTISDAIRSTGEVRDMVSATISVPAGAGNFGGSLHRFSSGAHSSDNLQVTSRRFMLALIESENEAADDLLLEALRLGTEQEKVVALDALIERETTGGLSGVVGLYAHLSDPLKLVILKHIKQFHQALRECGRSDDEERRFAAMKLIALGRQ